VGKDAQAEAAKKKKKKKRPPKRITGKGIPPTSIDAAVNASTTRSWGKKKKKKKGKETSPHRTELKPNIRAGDRYGGTTSLEVRLGGSAEHYRGGGGGTGR